MTLIFEVFWLFFQGAFCTVLGMIYFEPIVNIKIWGKFFIFLYIGKQLVNVIAFFVIIYVVYWLNRSAVAIK